MAGPTEATMAPGAVPLRDIQGLDAIPWWPPAPGWWALAAALLLVALALRYARPRECPPWRLPIATLGSWRRAARQELRTLRRQAADQPAKETVGKLSELLRRIAMARLGRAACAGLTGEDWLRWLTDHDPRGFDWQRHGIPLLATPYAPPRTAANDATALLTLIDAAAAWAEARPARQRGAEDTGGV
ncbi:DUF4381 domain-containing protein [Thiococcus pfennigii]|uniref:DUF4381 domain-containing protein n=1 Tax=Thiococcus pfennigii TaxID=1057 RepID=UPI001904CD6B|nr:DUF4381 domain-containing protein [Thiococcus pfennigii]MBK1730621.1 hypothetical protein [Thiococcus pfennigii]